MYVTNQTVCGGTVFTSGNVKCAMQVIAGAVGSVNALKIYGVMWNKEKNQT